MIAKISGSSLVEGEWFEWLYPGDLPEIEVGGEVYGVAGVHLTIEHLHVYTVAGSQASACRLNTLAHRLEFFTELASLGYEAVTLNGLRVKSGKPSRPFSLTIALV